MKIEIKYCSQWGYEPRAVSLTDRLLTTFKQKIAGLTLVPSGGGCFEITIDDSLVYSKLQTDEFPDEQAIVSLVQARIPAVPGARQQRWWSLRQARHRHKRAL